ncbi:Calcipressin-like protein [Neolecta irregularis DAH-3]|uniref:Calcipressin-like protein n=1 Tax=Neolecta irregularis (strain DAH-3) TaxID=1198029 RepID=A0A1U7LIY9_NEOID|nr:Calcipressin-like protein [Neolecta irregularis DAH-3]|eukprot:OLL22617.1 Calcipressin-like protein [Neolecta irregularis DAH-3]
MPAKSSPPSSIRTLSTRPPSLDFSCLKTSTPPTEVEPSNTLLITNLPPELFEEDTLASFRQNLSQDINILNWAPIKSFSRIVCVTESIDEAIETRKVLDGITISERRVRVYFGEHTKEVDLKDAHLHPPDLDRNWLVSPPGSLPVEWEQIREGPPNRFTLPEELTSALEKLALQTIPTSRPVTLQEHDHAMPSPHLSEKMGGTTPDVEPYLSSTPASAITKRSRSSTITLLEKGQKGNGGPGITVDDYDGDGMENHQRIGAIRGTALPPLAPN